MINVIDDNGKKYSIPDKNELSRGGEGKIISIGNGYVAKLYFDRSHSLESKKIYELSGLDDNLFVKPISALRGDCNGFIMKEIDQNEYYPVYSLFTPNFAVKHGLDKDYKKVIADRLIYAVKNAHDNNVVIGDLNPFNILVNDSLDVKVIDVDSFETKSFKHNGKLLEDIRDYAFNGDVSVFSDYFALAVILFNLFTYMHPFKGIHNKYGNKLVDRMVNKCSIISGEKNNIKIPKFYQPITDNVLNREFSEIFNEGKRFLMSMTSCDVKSVNLNGVVISDNLIITDILSDIILAGGGVLSIKSSNEFMAVICRNSTFVYKTPAKGIMVRLFTIDNSVKVFLSDRNVFCFKDGKLKKYDEKSGSLINIEQIGIKNVYLSEQVGNILIVVTTDDLLYKIYLDEGYMDYVKFSVLNVFHKSFKDVNGLFQHIGENNYLLYDNGDLCYVNNGKDNIQIINQINDCGILSYKDNDRVLTYMFRISQFGEIMRKDFPDHCQITANNDFIVAYHEDKLRFISKITLTEMVSFNANGLDSYSFVMNKCGIISYTNDTIKLINTK